MDYFVVVLVDDGLDVGRKWKPEKSFSVLCMIVKKKLFIDRSTRGMCHLRKQL
jgi:hypothetical protein